LAIIQAFNIDSGIAVGDVGIINTQGEFTGYFYAANTYNVTSNGTSSFLFNGADNPTLSLVRGFTYRFAVTSTGDPLWIKTDQSAGSANAYANVINNGTDAGTITFPVPFNAPDTLYYKSQNHSSMAGTIYVKDVGAAGPVLQVTGTDASISNSTGALTVVGGTGIGGNLNVGGANSVFSGNVTVGRVLTANILTSNTLSVSGNFTGNNVTANNITISGNISGNSLTVYSLNVTSGVQSSNGITVTGNTSTFTGNVVIGNGNVSITSTGVTIGNTFVSGGNVSVGNTFITAGNITIGNTSVTSSRITANAIYAAYYFDANGNVFTSSGGTVGGASNAFTRVAVSGQPSAIANSNNAVLTFSAGSGITLSSNGISNTITIATTYGNTVPFLSQTFTANGAQTSFVLSSTVSATDLLVTVENIPQIPNIDYTMSGALMTFDAPPDANAVISVRTFGTATPLSNTIPILAQTFTANGSQTTFPLNGYVLATDLLVLVDTVPQQPLTNYYVSGLNLTFDTAPANGAVVDIRTFGNSYAGNGYTSITGNVFTDRVYSSSVYAGKYYFYDGTPFASNPAINQSFTANGAQTTFALANTVSAVDLLVSIDGLIQPTNGYLINNGNILTFDTVVPAGSVVEARTFTATSPLSQNTLTTFAVSGQSSVTADGPTIVTLAAGSGMTLTTNNVTKTVTFASSGGGGATNSWANFAVTGQSTLTAQSNNATLTLVPGSGITIATNSPANSVTISSTATGNSFLNFAVAGQTTLSPTSNTGTLSFAAGSGMTITTNPSTNTITFVSSGGSVSANALSGTNDTFVANGSQTSFIVTPANTSANDMIVTVDSVIQTPTTNYTVSGNTVTFTEAPVNGASIEIRTFTTGGTTSGSSTVDNAATISANTAYLSNIISSVYTTGVPVGITATTIDQFETSKYRTSKYIISATNGSEHQASEAMIVHNGTIAYIVTYATVYTGVSKLVNFTSSISSGNVLLQGTSLSGTSNVKVQKTYIGI
jgi:hypothetical protein